MTEQLIILGINDDQTVCDECGKIDLHRTVVIGTTDRAEVGRYGTTCVNKMLKDSNQATIKGNVGATAARIDAVRRGNLSDALKGSSRAMEDGDYEKAVACLHDAGTYAISDSEGARVRAMTERRWFLQGGRHYAVTSANERRSIVRMFPVDLQVGDKIRVTDNTTGRGFLGWLAIESIDRDSDVAHRLRVTACSATYHLLG